MKREDLIVLAETMVEQTGGYSSISMENRELINQFIGHFGENVDQLINDFYKLNCKVDNGGAPILKSLIHVLECGRKPLAI